MPRAERMKKASGPRNARTGLRDTGWRIPTKYLTGERLDFCRGILRGLNDTGVLNQIFGVWKEILSHRSGRKIRDPKELQEFYALHMDVVDQAKGLMGVFFEDLPRAPSKAQLEEAARAVMLALPPPQEDGEMANKTSDFLKRLRGGDAEAARKFMNLIREEPESDPDPEPDGLDDDREGPDDGR